MPKKLAIVTGSGLLLCADAEAASITSATIGSRMGRFIREDSLG